MCLAWILKEDWKWLILKTNKKCSWQNGQQNYSEIKKTVWSQIAKHFFTPIVSIRCALNATIDPKHNQAINQIESHFWREATKATTLMNKNREPDLDSIRSEPIWNNKNIKFKGHPLFYRNLCKAGIVYLQDLWVSGHIMRYEQIEQTVGTNGRLLFEYNALVNAIPEWIATTRQWSFHKK